MLASWPVGQLTWSVDLEVGPVGWNRASSCGVFGSAALTGMRVWALNQACRARTHTKAAVRVAWVLAYGTHVHCATWTPYMYVMGFWKH